MSELAVSVAGVSKVFPLPFSGRTVVAVRDLNLSIAAGEVYGLLGPNGSGKSTTLKIILGLVPPTRGRAEIFGRASSDVASREAVGFLPESLTSPSISPAQRRCGSTGSCAACAAKACALASMNC
jgi:ABC-2 type transport system ATP-binding protein